MRMTAALIALASGFLVMLLPAAQAQTLPSAELIDYMIADVCVSILAIT